MNTSQEYIEFSFTRWREGFLRVILIGASVFGLAAVIASLIGTTEVVYKIIYISSYVILLAVTLIPMPYWIRATTMLVLLFSLGVSGLIETGIWGDSRVFMLSAIVMASLLFSRRVGWILTGLTMLSYIIFGWLVVTGRFTITSDAVIGGGLDIWLSGSTTILLLAVIIVSGIGLIQNEFTNVEKRTNTLLGTLYEERTALEERIAERTYIIERRSLELETIAEVARDITTIRDLNTLLNIATNLIRERFHYYHVGIFLIDDRREYAILRAASSIAAKTMLEQKHKLKVNKEGIVGYVSGSGQPRIALNVGEDAVHFLNPLLPDTQSEIALPLRSRSLTIGVLDIQTTESSAFGEQDLQALQLLADQLVIAIENAQLAGKTESTLEELNKTYQIQTQSAWQREIRDRRQSAYEYDGQQVKSTIQRLPENVLKQLESGKAVVLDKQTNLNNDQPTKRETLFVPLMILDQFIGVIGLEQEVSGRGWTADEIAVAEAAASRAALSLENARLLADSQKRAFKEKTIGDISAKIGSSVDIDNIIQITIQELSRTMPDTEVAIQFQRN